MNRFGIKYQILLITFIPAFLVDVFFTYWHINTSIVQTQELLQSKGQTISRQLAGAFEFNLFADNDTQIQSLLDQTIDTNDIMLAAVFNLEGELIAEAVSDIYKTDQSLDYFYFHQAITSESVSIPDVFSLDQADESLNQTIGWVHLYISKQRLEATKSTAIHDSIILFMFVLVMTLILATIISRGIATPISKLSEHLRRVETGHLGELIEPMEFNEIGDVQRGFNRMTQALLTNRKHLNDRNQQATLQLSEAITDLETKNRELGIARDEAQNANRIKSEFLANMSHEIRTPINGIKGFISLMGQSDLTSRQKRYADIILKSTNELTNIIDEILDFSRLESGKLQVVEDNFDLFELIEQTRDMLLISVISKKIDLILIIYSDTPRIVCGDKLRLKQILLNLMGNAIKFTDQGRVVVRVSLEQETNNEAAILITVEDTGIGISDQDQLDLFTAFSQVESAANRRYTGTGLGLVTSKNLVNLMGGEITVNSVCGEGSAFSIRLPFSTPVNYDFEATEPPLEMTALIFASRQPCLQEIQSLFDRAGVFTEATLIETSQSSSEIREKIRHNLKFIDLIIFDLRHLSHPLDEIIDDRLVADHRVIIMHYDQNMVSDLQFQQFEFVSNITTSSNLNKLLGAAPQSKLPPATVQLASTLHETSKKVLLVDDNPTNLKLGAELVRLWGHQAIEAGHASAALALFRQQYFDLIVLDIQMPDIDGTELLQLMREEKPQDKTPVIALTANILPADAERLLNIGFDYYLSKPIDEDRFKAILNGSLIQYESISQATEESLDIDSLASVDPDKSLLLSASNESLMLQVFEILLREIPAHKRHLEEALETSDHDRITMIIHKIHGITCYASLPRMRQLVLSVQQSMSKGNSDIVELIRNIISELASVQQATERLVRNYSDTVE